AAACLARRWPFAAVRHLSACEPGCGGTRRGRAGCVDRTSCSPICSMRPADMGALPGRQTQGCRPAAHGPAPSFLMSQPGVCGALAGVAAAVWWSAAGAALAGAAGSVAVSARGACAAWAAGGLPSRRRQLETPAAACRAGAATGVIAPVWDLRGRPADGRGVAGTGAAVRYAAAADCALAAAAGDLSTVLGVSAGADLPLS